MRDLETSVACVEDGRKERIRTRFEKGQMRSLGMAAMCVSSAMAWGDAQYFGRGELPMAVCEAASAQNESVETFVDSIIEPRKPRKGVLGKV